MDKKPPLPKLPNLGAENNEDDETFMNAVSIVPSGSGEIASQFAARPYLVLIAGDTMRRVFPLGDGDDVIGRQDVLSTIPIHDAGISRRHARIACDGVDYTIEDLGSANGTYLNGKRIEGKYRLAPGDRIRLGPTILLRFEWPTYSDDGFGEAESPTSVSLLQKAEWSPDSWRSKVVAQLVKYEDPVALKNAVAELRGFPPLVTSWEITRLKTLIADAQNGTRFLLQGGDCAETFAGCDSVIITNKLKILLQMSLVLTHAARKPVIRVGRIGGQYAKPRSKPTEVRDGIELPSYLGDLVNRPEFTAAGRRADPELLVTGYQRAALTMNYIRSLCTAGFSSLQGPRYFDLPVFERDDMPAAIREEYARLRRQVSEGLHFLRAMGDQAVDELANVEFFASHEGLNLEYEFAQTRQVPERDGWYCLTTHLPWIGERTRSIDGAHVEYFRGVENPIGVKIGPNATPAELIGLLRTLNPSDESGKILLIIRMGAGKVPTRLPPLIEAVARSRRKVLWVTDPMHGNGTVTKTGIKTRDFSSILQEVEETFDAHEKCGSVLGGVHFELTGDDVTECIGAGLTEADLDTRYLTTCDPRLNYRQAMEMTFCIARRISASSVRRPSSLPPPLMRR